MDDPDRLLFWFDFTYRCRSIPIFFGIEAEQSYLRRAHGITFGPPCPIVVLNVANNRRDNIDTLIHELGHVVLWDYPHIGHRQNETVCRRMEAFVPLLLSCGFRPPPMPAGHAAMRRRATRLAAKSAA